MNSEEIDKEFQEDKLSFGSWAKNLIASNPQFYITEVVEYLPVEATASEISDLVIGMASVLPDHIKKQNLYTFERVLLKEEGVLKIVMRYRSVKYDK